MNHLAVAFAVVQTIFRSNTENVCFFLRFYYCTLYTESNGTKVKCSSALDLVRELIFRIVDQVLPSNRNSKLDFVVYGFHYFFYLLYELQQKE